MKPKYIFTAVFAVSTLLAVLLPGIGAHRVKTVDAYSAQAPAAMATLSPAAAATIPPIAAQQPAADNQPAAAAQPTLAPFAAGGQDPAAAQAVAVAAPDTSQPAADASPVLPPASAPSGDPANIPQTALPGLNAFIDSLRGLPASQVAGAYVDGLFAFPVVQQPADNPDYVSPNDNTLTQFVKPERFDVIGLLAHNYLSGKPFAQLQQGQEIMIVYGGGRIARYRVTGFARYQAIDSQDINTDYMDLDSPQGPALTQQQVFSQVYTTDGQLVLQTCIEKNGDYSWGRLFVIASPE